MFVWLTSLVQSLSSVMVNPWLFLAGVAAVSLPVLIHLLNKRKFIVVDWAAMDFLLDADKKNRRRIRLENLLLLLLRCLAVLLIGLLLARPFIPTSMTAGLIDAAQFERIVLLDDSLSMQTRLGNESAWEVARRRLTDLTHTLAAEPSDNSLTLLATSHLATPTFNAAHLAEDSVDEINAAIEQLEPSDSPANLAAALKHLEEYLANQPANVNRVVYLISDLRQRDWKLGDTSSDAPLGRLARLSKQCGGCFVVDVANDEDRNLAIAEVRSEATLVADVPARFDVGVTNFGTKVAQDIRVKFTAGDALPLVNEIDHIDPGQTAATSFSFTFSAADESPDAASSGKLSPRRVQLELLTARQGDDDRLPADSIAYYPARLVRGVPVLIVDGDPSAAFGKSESFYLQRALAPGGPVRSGVVADVVTENELESLNFEKYQVIFLCNVYRLGDKTTENIENLERWVEAGGGLVMMPGDQIDEQFYNDHYFRDGQGLSPLKLETIRGDESEAKWAVLRVEEANHPLLKVFAGQNNPFLDNVKAFRWWGASAANDQLGKSVAVLARLNDVDDSPVFAEKSFGRGRVLASSLPADADWTNWTSDPSYLIVMQEMVRHMSGNPGDKGLLRVGEPIHQPLDLATYDLAASLTGPHELQANLQAAAPESAPASGTPASANPTVWELHYGQTTRQGFYELKLDRREGGAENVLFAANVEPSEGNLQRVDLAAMRRELGDAPVQILSGGMGSLAGLGSQTEIWWYLLWALVATLCCEQVLGWYFGAAR